MLSMLVPLLPRAVLPLLRPKHKQSVLPLPRAVLLLLLEPLAWVKQSVLPLPRAVLLLLPEPLAWVLVQRLLGPLACAVWHPQRCRPQ
jgi:hypothetical protein